MERGSSANGRTHMNRRDRRRHSFYRERNETRDGASGDSVAGGPATGTPEVLENGKLVPFDEPFWFSVAAFRLEIVVYRP